MHPHTHTHTHTRIHAGTRSRARCSERRYAGKRCHYRCHCQLNLPVFALDASARNTTRKVTNVIVRCTSSLILRRRKPICKTDQSAVDCLLPALSAGWSSPRSARRTIFVSEWYSLGGDSPPVDQCCFHHLFTKSEIDYARTCVHACARARVCVCVCVRACAGASACVCGCVCACVWTGFVCLDMRACVCGCTCVCACVRARAIACLPVSVRACVRVGIIITYVITYVIRG